MTEKQGEGGSAVYHIDSCSPCSDIVICASPQLVTKRITKDQLTAEVVYPKDIPQLGVGKLEAVSESYAQLEKVLGPAHHSGSLRFVYSPRLGWGYARPPMFVNPGLYLAQQKSDSEPDHHGDYHELAHFWWSIADTWTPNDWINEGGAEYSAFRLSRINHGEDFASRLLEDYITHAKKAKTNTPIVLTENTSTDRYVNRYEKTTLMFLGAEKRFGQDELAGFLKTFYLAHRGAKSATTDSFTEMAGTCLGEEARAYFDYLLNLESWSLIDIRLDILKIL